MDVTFINNMDPIAVWGAVLSTFLVIRELYKSRTSLKIGWNFTGDVDGTGNEIFIRNLSGKPIIITYWEIQRCTRKWFTWKAFDATEPDIGFVDIVIAPHSSHKMSFNGSNYFSTSRKLLNGGASSAFFSNIW